MKKKDSLQKKEKFIRVFLKMKSLTGIFLSFLALFFLFSPTILGRKWSTDLKNFHSRAISLETPHPQDVVEFLIGVKFLNMDVIETALLDVSDPFSPNYGKHWSPEKVKETTANPIGLKEVKDYFNDFSHSIEELPGGHFFKVKATIESLERNLKAQMKIYQVDQVKHLRTTYLETPDFLDQHISLIGGLLDDFEENIRSRSVKREHTKRVGTFYTGIMTPSVFRNYYNVPMNATASGTIATIYNLDTFQSQLNVTTPTVFSLQDLSNFLIQKNGWINPNNSLNNILFPISSSNLSAYDYQKQGFLPSIDESSNVSCQSLSAYGCNGEATLDIQTVAGFSNLTFSGIFVPRSPQILGTPSNLVLYIYGFLSEIQVLLPSFRYSVVTISYGFGDNGFGSANVFCDIIAQLGMIGTTVLMSSGDFGYSGTNDGSGCTDPRMPQMNFCPFLTSVGATMGAESGLEEVTCSLRFNGNPEAIITSGGGFSTIFEMPYWQKSLVDQYLSNPNNLPNANFNRSMRAIPDVSMAGHNYRLNLNGISDASTTFDGTSASSPALAAVIGMVNSAREAAGMPPMGFINPFLYAYPGYFIRDITLGDNSCDENSCCPTGFKAATGWDAATGLGSIDVAAFISTALNPPNISTTTSTSTTTDSAFSAGSALSSIFSIF